MNASDLIDCMADMNAEQMQPVIDAFRKQLEREAADLDRRQQVLDERAHSNATTTVSCLVLDPLRVSMARLQAFPTSVPMKKLKTLLRNALAARARGLRAFERRNQGQYLG